MKHQLIECISIPKKTRANALRLLDEFLIDLNEEIININGDLSQESYLDFDSESFYD